jgi:hypothetical protein
MQPVLCNFLLCNNIRAESGKFNIEGVFYRVHAAAYPCRYRCLVVAGWYGEGGNYTFGLRFLPPDKSRHLFEIPPYPFSLSAASPYFNGVVEVQLPFDCEGVYWFEVTLDGRTAGFFPVHAAMTPVAGQDVQRLS